MSRQISKEAQKQILQAVETCPSNMHEAARLADMPFESFKYRAMKLGVYVPNPHGRRKVKRARISTEDILNGLYPHYSSAALKQRLMEENIKEEKCEECGIGSTWNNKPLTLQLDHIDGNSSNHLLNNLQLLCPNCHTQTKNWGSKNKSKSTPTDNEILAELERTPYVTKALANLKMSKSSQNHKRVRQLLDTLK